MSQNLRGLKVVVTGKKIVIIRVRGRREGFQAEGPRQMPSVLTAAGDSVTKIIGIRYILDNHTFHN